MEKTNKKYRKGILITLEGKTFDSIKEACEYYNISYSTISNRLNRGWTIEEAFGLTNKENKHGKKPITIQDNVFKSLAEACRYYNLSYNIVSNRLNRGWTIEEAFELVYRNNNCNTVIVKGKTFNSVKEACDYYGLNYGTVNGRIHKGWSIEKAFDKPTNIKRKNNKNSKSKPITVDGKYFECIKDAAEYYGLNYGTLKWKLRTGCSIEDAFNLKERKFIESGSKLIELVLTEEEFNNLEKLSMKLEMDKIDIIKQSLKSFELVNNIIECKNEENKYEPVMCVEPDITIYITSDNNILCGKKNGKLMRNEANLDELEKNDEQVRILIDSDILSFNTSYFIGLFKDSKNKYTTKNKFLKKYKFDCDEYIMKDIMDGIDSLYKLPFWKRR